MDQEICNLKMSSQNDLIYSDIPILYGLYTANKTHFTTKKVCLLQVKKRKITYSETYLLKYSNFRISVVVSDQYIYCFHVSLLSLVSFVFLSSESRILFDLSLHQYFYNLQFSFFHFHSQRYLHHQSNLNTFSIFCWTKPSPAFSI